jgi:hypothetical protein
VNAVDLEAVSHRIRAIFREMDQAEGAAKRRGRFTPPEDLVEQLEALQGAVHSLSEERQRLLATEAELKSLLGCDSARQLVHQVRNLLNNLTLLKRLNAKRLEELEKQRNANRQG